MWFFVSVSAVLALVTGLTQFTNDQGNKVSLFAIFNQSNIGDLKEQNANELARAELIATMKREGINSRQLREGLLAASSGTGPDWSEALVAKHNPFGLSDINLEHFSFSDVKSLTHYVESRFEAHSARTLASASQLPAASNANRLNLGYRTVFSNALTVDHVRCIACHVTIYGDIAEYGSTDETNGANDRDHGTW